MSFYKMVRIEDVKEFAITACGKELIIPSPDNDPNILMLFHNGDKMTINIADKMLEWDPIHPGSPATSRLSLRFMQWFVKGYLTEMKDNKEET